MVRDSNILRFDSLKKKRPLYSIDDENKKTLARLKMGRPHDPSFNPSYDWTLPSGSVVELSMEDLEALSDGTAALRMARSFARVVRVERGEWVPAHQTGPALSGVDDIEVGKIYTNAWMDRCIESSYNVALLLVVRVYKSVRGYYKGSMMVSCKYVQPGNFKTPGSVERLTVGMFCRDFRPVTDTALQSVE